MVVRASEEEIGYLTVRFEMNETEEKEETYEELKDES